MSLILSLKRFNSRGHSAAKSRSFKKRKNIGNTTTDLLANAASIPRTLFDIESQNRYIVDGVTSSSRKVSNFSRIMELQLPFEDYVKMMIFSTRMARDM